MAVWLRHLSERIRARRGNHSPTPPLKKEFWTAGLALYEESFGTHLRAHQKELAKRIAEMPDVTQSNRQQYFSEKRPKLVLRAVHKLFPDAFTSPPLTILDVGCGFGDYLALFRRAGHRAAGTIYGPTIDDFLFMHRRLGLRVLLHDAASSFLPFRDECCDVVWCSSMITLDSMLGKTEHIMAELQRVLKPGGRLILRTHVEKLPLHGLKAPVDLAPADGQLLFADEKDFVWQKPTLQ